MSFAQPIVFLAFFAVPLLIALYAIVQRRRAQYAVRFTNLDLLASVVDRAPGWRRHVPAVLYLAALGALVFALARPETIEKVPKEEATVILVTDVSGSMNAEDVEPTRLAAAKQSAHDLVETLPPKFQVALIAFASNVRTIVPPTTDREIIAAGIESLSAVGGTAMGDAIIQAVDLGQLPALNDAAGDPQATPAPASDDEQPSTVIVLLSDGYNSVGLWDPIDAANEALAANIPIYTVALGTPNGYVDIEQPNGRFARVPVPPDEATLRRIADITGAKSFKAPSAEELEEVYSDLGSKIGFDEEGREQTVWFAFAAALLVAAAGGLSIAWFNRFP